MLNKIENLAKEIDERIRRSAAKAAYNPLLKANSNSSWMPNPTQDDNDPNFDYGVLSLREEGDPATLAGDVKVTEGQGIKIETDEPGNSLSFGISEGPAEILGLGAPYPLVQVTTNDPGEDIVSVFRMMTTGDVFALTANQVWRVETGTNLLVAVPGAVPGTGQEFTCVKVLLGWAYIGTREVLGTNVVVYRFDGTSLVPDGAILPRGPNLAVTSITVAGMALYALIGDPNPPNFGFEVRRRDGLGNWQQVLTWQSGNDAGEIHATNELIISVFASGQTDIHSLYLGTGQTSVSPVHDLPNSNTLSLLLNVQLGRRENEVLVTDRASIYSVTDAVPKTWSGAKGIDLMSLFASPSPYSTPPSYDSVDSAEARFGIEAGGLFIFGVRVVYKIDLVPTFEEWGYLLAYDGGELVEILAVPDPGTPFLRPVEVAPDGSIYLIGFGPTTPRYIWRLPRNVIDGLAYNDRHIGSV